MFFYNVLSHQYISQVLLSENGFYSGSQWHQIHGRKHYMNVLEQGSIVQFYQTFLGGHPLAEQDIYYYSYFALHSYLQIFSMSLDIGLY